MTILRRVAALTLIAPSAAAPSLDALAQAYDATSRVLTEAAFTSTGDAFTLTKLADHGARVYAEYRYVRRNGTLQTGTHRGSSIVGTPVRFDHDFGENRPLEFRVCVETDGPDLCSGTDEGENWTTAYA